MVSIKKVTVVGHNRLYDILQKLIHEYATISIHIVDNNVYEVRAWNRRNKTLLVKL